MLLKPILEGKKVKDVIEQIISFLENVKEKYGDYELLKLFEKEGGKQKK